ncbi:hypothetical protein [Xanthobacter dioxanivorans]|uniref:hypothetical protein n=1 Tax=Xanthobacter dioxanivorans TaxID=2528964 RepID=UPI001E6558EC|nr:hypothetical protein [Xanthobacter dioxanivorans]
MGLSRRMGVTGRKLALAALVAATGISAVTQAWAQGASCAQLEGALASLDRGGNAAAQQAQAAKMRSDLDRLSAQARGMGCDAPRGFLIFQGPPRPPECDQISDQISRLRSSLAGIERGGTDQSGQRRALIVALAQNNCGPQYTAAVQAARRSEPQRPKNFFEAIFGAPQNDVEESAPDIDLAPWSRRSRPIRARSACAPATAISSPWPAAPIPAGRRRTTSCASGCARARKRSCSPMAATSSRR